MVGADACDRRPSHFTSASSPFVFSTVPNSPVGFPKSAKPITRSPGFSSASGAEGWTSAGLLAQSRAAAAPACDEGSCGALRSFDVPLIDTAHIPLPQWPARLFISLVNKSIGLESMAPPIQTAKAQDDSVVNYRSQSRKHRVAVRISALKLVMENDVEK